MRGEGILSENHDERARSFAPGRGKGRDAGPHCAAAECAGHAHRPVRRHIRSAACGASRRLPAGAAPAWPRPGMVAGYAGQSAEGYQGLGAARRAGRRRAGAGAPSAHRRHRPRGRAGHGLYLRDRVLPAAALSRRALRLDHGRRQSAQLPSLAALARHRAAGADRDRRSARTEPLCDRQRRGAGAGALPPSRNGGNEACGPQAAGLDLPARPQIAAVVDGAARRPRVKTSLDDSCLTAKQLNPLTRRAYLKASPGFGGRGRQLGAKGSAPLSTVVISRDERRVPEAVSRMRLDAEEILRLVLARLDDMKAEDILTIDLRDKSSIGDYMVVSSGRSQRHVGSVADRVVEDLHKAGVAARVEGAPQCDWVLIDAGDVIVHVFRPEVRAFYNLEKMWVTSRPAQRAS